MKTSFLITFLLLGSLMPVSGQKNLSSRFELIRPTEDSFRKGQQGKLIVTDDIFGQCRNYPNDIRIFGADGTAWPFFLHVPKETVAMRKLTPEILNRSFVEGDENYLQFDLLIPQTNGKVPVHNRLELWTSGRNFIRRVEVFSVEPGGRMASGYLIDFSNQRNARNRIIRYPASDAEKLHVRIYSNARAADENFSLSSARLHYRIVDEVDRETVSAEELEVPKREQQEDAQTYLFDVGETGRPVEFALLDVETPSFARSVSVYGRNTDRDPWKWVGGGAVHKLEDDEQKEIKLNAKHRFIKLQIFHYDDQPLDIQSIKLQAIPRYLVFEAASAGEAGVYFRAWDMKSPRYDLKGRIDKEVVEKLPRFRTLETKANEAVKAQPWRKYSKLLAGLAVAAVSLLVLWIIVSMLRQQKETAGQ